MPISTLQDKIVLVTGATSGIGEVTARELAKAGAQVILLARNPQKAERTRQAILAVCDHGKVDVIICDLSSLSQVRSAAAAVRLAYPRLDILVNNAGLIMGKKREESVDGYELTLATNYLGPFLLTAVLFDLLLKSGSARIINLSSAAHRVAKPDFNNLQLHKGYSSLRAYANSKLFNYMFTAELDRRLRSRNLPVVTNAVHPGGVASGFGGSSDGWIAILMRTFSSVLISPEKGAATSLYLATSAEGGQVSGRYWNSVQKVVRPRNAFITPENEQRLWTVSGELTGQPFL
jgi:retinol dehydrogenase-12